MVLSILTRMAQHRVAEETGHLRALIKASEHEDMTLDTSIEVSKAELRVYYAFLQHDKAKCRSAIDAARQHFTEVIGDVMENSECVVGLVDQRSDEAAQHYMGDKTDENTRQLGKALQMKMDNFEFMYWHL
jgi:hypothetical protein